MLTDNQWLIMTYYCPTHGSENKLEPILLTKEDLKKIKSKEQNKTSLND